MRRRRCLRLATAGGLGALTGCVVGYRRDRTASRAESDSDRTADSAADLDLPVPREEMTEAASTDAIPGIINPAFGSDWSGLSMEVRTRLDPRRTYEIEPRLCDDDPVVGVEWPGEARLPAPDTQLARGRQRRPGRPAARDLLSAVRERPRRRPVGRRAGDALRRFGPPVTERARHVRRDHGEPLESDRRDGHRRRPHRRDALTPPVDAHHVGRVASHPSGDGRPPAAPESDTLAGPSKTRDYRQNPYEGYQSGDAVGVTGDELEDDRLHPKTRVLGVSHEGVARA